MSRSSATSLFGLVGETTKDVDVDRFIMVPAGLLLTGSGATPNSISGLTFRIVSAFQGPCTHMAALPFAKSVEPASFPTSNGFAVPLAIIRSMILKISCTSL
ncbi:hypothetical protein D3C76_1694840 [compost metagenome]